MIRRFVIPFSIVITTCAMSSVAILLHFVCLGLVDAGFLVARRLWYPALAALGGFRTEPELRFDPTGRGPFVIVANHQSNFDVPVLMRWLPIRFRFIAKKELYWIPFFGWYLYLAGYVAIDRKNRDRSIESMRRAGRIMRARGLSVVVFAEGTRSPDGEVQDFKKGAFHLAVEAGVPILPVSIDGSYRVQDRHRLEVRPGTIRFLVHDPVATEGLAAADVPALLETVRTRIVSGVEELRHRRAEAPSPS